MKRNCKKYDSKEKLNGLEMKGDTPGPAYECIVHYMLVFACKSFLFKFIYLLFILNTCEQIRYQVFVNNLFIYSQMENIFMVVVIVVAVTSICPCVNVYIAGI